MTFLSLLLATALAEEPCPSYVENVEAAYAAIGANRTQDLELALSRARAGVRCGELFQNRVLRAKFWLAHAVMLDGQGDLAARDDALFAAWRSDPSCDLSVLPPGLRPYFTTLTERPVSEASFRLSPLPPAGAILAIDGVPTDPKRAQGANESEYTTTAGAHIIQLLENLQTLDASQGNVFTLPEEGVSKVNVYDEEDRYQPRFNGSFPPPPPPPGPSGGCGKRR